MGILEMDFERILGVTFFISSSHSIMLWVMYSDIVLQIDVGAGVVEKFRTIKY